jgi:hypothetical protein
VLDVPATDGSFTYRRGQKIPRAAGVLPLGWKILKTFVPVACPHSEDEQLIVESLGVSDHAEILYIGCPNVWVADARIILRRFTPTYYL